MTFFGGPLDGLVAEPDLRPFVFSEVWGQPFKDCHELTHKPSPVISSWNQAPWTLTVNDDGSHILCESSLGQHEYAWCSVHREYEFEGSPARHV